MGGQQPPSCSIKGAPAQVRPDSSQFLGPWPRRAAQESKHEAPARVAVSALDMLQPSRSPNSGGGKTVLSMGASPVLAMPAELLDAPHHRSLGNALK